MSREIDERIVAMHFNNEQFERGARQSLSTLEKLKTGLNMEGTSNSLGILSKATTKAFNLKKQVTNVGNFSKALGSMGKMAKSALNMATAPIRALTDGLNTLGRYTGTVFGIDVASKIIQTGEQIVQSFTIDPMKTGWSEYELTMDSIKTILTGTQQEYKKLWGKNYTEDKHLAVVKKYLEELNQYADKTIYSFKDMTSNIGKFTSNGVSLKDAVASMKGISNAAAYAGQGADEASRAMYNLSQAISVGKLTVADWKSIENANMATKDFKQTFMDVAVAMGKLEKIGDKYYTKETKNATSTSKKKKKLSKEEQAAALKAREVTAENFRNTLSKGWADSDVITKTLSIWGGELTDNQLRRMGLSAKQVEEYKKLGQQATQAAQEVRTFKKMWDALLEAAQSGWAKTWEIIFGDVKEATKLWSHFNETFSKIIDNMTKKRNNILKVWKKNGGRNYLIKSLDRIIQVFQLLGSAVSKAWKKVFGTINGKELANRTKAVSIFLGKLIKWFGTLNDSGSRISKIVKILQGVFTIVKLITHAFVKVGSVVAKFLEENLDFFVAISDFITGSADALTKIIDRVITIIKLLVDAVKKALQEAFGNFDPKVFTNYAKSIAIFFSKLIKWFGTLDDSTSRISKVVKVLKAVFNIVKLVTGAVIKVARFIAGLFAGNADTTLDFLTTLAEFFTGDMFEGSPEEVIDKFIAKIKELTAIDVLTWLGDVGTAFVNFFTNVGNNVIEFLENNGFARVIGFIKKSVFNIETAWLTAKMRFEEFLEDSGLGAFLSNPLGWIVDEATSFVQSVASFLGFTGATTTSISDTISIVAFQLETDWLNTKLKIENFIESSGFGEFISNTWGWLLSKVGSIITTIKESESWNSVITWFSNAKTILSKAWGDAQIAVITWFYTSGVSKFISNLWGWIIDHIGTAVSTVISPEAWTAVIDWFDGAYATLSNAYNNTSLLISSWLKGENGPGKFFSDLFGWITGIVGSAASAITNPDSWSKFLEWLNGAKTTIETAYNGAKTAITEWLNGDKSFGQFFSDIWTWIKDVVGDTASAITNPEIWDKFFEWLGNAKKTIEEKYEAAKKAITEWINGSSGFGKFFSDIWTWIKDVVGNTASAIANPETWDNLITWLGNAKTSLETAWNDAKTGLIEFINTSGIGEFFTNIWNWIISQFKGKENADASETGEIADQVEQTTQNSEEIEETVEESISVFERIIGSISSLVSSVGDSKIWDTIGNFFKTVFEAIGNAISNFTNDSILVKLLDVIDRIAKLILAVVDKIVALGEGMVAGGPEHLDSWITAIGVMLGYIGLMILRMKTATAVGSIDSIGDNLMKISIAIGIVAVAIAAIGALNEEVFKTGAIRIAGIAVVLGALYLGIKKFADAAEGNDTAIPPWERVVTKLIDKIGMVAMVWVALQGIIPVIEAIGKAGIAPGVMLETLGGLAGLIAVIGGLFILFSKVKISASGIGYAILGVVAAIAAAFLSLAEVAVGINLLGKAIDALGGPEHMSKMVANVKSFLSGISEIIGAFFGSAVGSFQSGKDGAYLNGMTEAMVAASDTANNIDEAGMTRLQNAMKALKIISDNLPKNPDILKQWFSGGLTFSQVGEVLSTLVDDFAAASTAASGIEDDKIKKFDQVFTSLKKLLGVTEYFVKYDNLSTDGLERLFDFLINLNNSMFDDLISTDGLSESLSSYSSFVDGIASIFNTGIESAAPQISIQPLLDQMIADLAGTDENKKRIQESLKTLLGDFKLSGDEGTGDIFSGLTGAANSLTEAFDFSSFKNEEGTFDFAKMLGVDLTSDDPGGINSLFTSVSSKIDTSAFNTAGEGSMNEFINGMKTALEDQTITATITPVYSGGTLEDIFGAEGFTVNGTVSIDASSLTALQNTMIDSTNRMINTVVNSANNLGTRISNLEGAIRNMKIVLNTGTVAGSVDGELGRRSALGTRTTMVPGYLK